MIVEAKVAIRMDLQARWMSRIFLLEDGGYLWTTPLGWVATKTLHDGWTHEKTLRNMPRLSGGRKASCRMDETKVRDRRRREVDRGGRGWGTQCHGYSQSRRGSPKTG